MAPRGAVLEGAAYRCDEQRQASTAGALPAPVAQMLGHNEAGVTMSHYIKPGTGEAVTLERSHRTLTDKN